MQSYNPDIAVTTSVWALSLSLAATQEIDVSFFSSSYLDVSVQRVSSPCGVTGLLPAGLSHSDICGSILVCKSPQLFAAYHVLLRLQEPRHPPYALSYFLTVLHQPIVQYKTLSHFLNHVKELRSFPIESALLYAFRVENKGVEPLTPCLQSRCSSQLS